MVREVVMLMSALVAASASAQDMEPARMEDEDVPVRTQAVEGSQPQILVASTTPIENRSALLPANGPTTPSQPGDGADERTASKRDAEPATMDCSVVEALLEDAVLASRIYKSAPKPSVGESSSWLSPPVVRRATHCGDRYIILVKSRSTEPWVLKAARLEGAGGKMLKVRGVRTRLGEEDWNYNLLVVEAPQGAEPDYPLSKIHLTGEDGRVALVEGVVLP